MVEGRESPGRRSDLDALRAFAMLLGIVLHGAISFVPGAGLIWGVQDSESSTAFTILMELIHGWRMPLFFLVSGFFTMMLWKKRGLLLLLKQRSLRILLPLVIGMLTIIPVNIAVGIYVRSDEQKESANHGQPVTKVAFLQNEEEISVDIFAAVVVSDLESMQSYLDQGGNLDQRDAFGSTPLHIACLFGRSASAVWLIRNGADVEAKNHEGETPESLLYLDWETTKWIADQFSIPVEEQELRAERIAIAAVLQEELDREIIIGEMRSSEEDIVGALIWIFFYLPVWQHLWFLYFLCWFVIGFAVVVPWMTKLHWLSAGRPWVVGWRRFLWLLPLTAIPQMFMAWEPGAFGPDTSIGLLPLPAVLVYYAIFFGFGAVYFLADDVDVKVGRHAVVMIAFSLVVLFPLALWLKNPEGIGGRAVYSLIEVSFAWLMTFGLLGVFHRWLAVPRGWVRYLSDASYWMYLVHVPLIILMQFWVSTWQIPAVFKFLLICGSTIAVLLVSYQAFVRWTYIGWLLNGRMYPWAKTDKQSEATT